jgi:hypothetical protein
MSKIQLGLISLLLAFTAGVVISPATAMAGCRWDRTSKSLYEDIDSAKDECIAEDPKKESAYELTKNAQWLDNGTAITSATSADTSGELLLENVLNGAAILCSALFGGTVGPSGAYEVTKVFNLSGVEIKELEGSGIKCTSIKLCEAGDAELWPLNLPFKASLNLGTEVSSFFLVAEPNGSSLLPGYRVLCLVLGVGIEESCEAGAGSNSEVLNAASDVEIVGVVGPLATCGGSAEAGLIENSEVISLSAGGTLSVSE